MVLGRQYFLMMRFRNFSAAACSDSGYFTYIITARRIISGELLKYRKGLLMTGTYPKPQVAPNDWSDNAASAALPIDHRSGGAHQLNVQRILVGRVGGTAQARIVGAHHRRHAIEHPLLPLRAV